MSTATEHRTSFLLNLMLLQDLGCFQQKRLPDKSMRNLKRIQITLWIVVGLAAVLYLVALQWSDDWARQQTIERRQDTGVSAIPLGFDLVDHRGQRVTAEDFAGKWMHVFFGFTNCPDICPTTLVDIAQVIDDLGPQSAQVQPLFITVDPERDTLTALAEYISAFHPSITGLTGTEEQIAAAAASFRVHYERVWSDAVLGENTLPQNLTLGDGVRVHRQGAPLDISTDDYTV